MGRFACKAVAYEVADEFFAAYDCHCSNCRALRGSAFLPVGQIEVNRITVTKGPSSRKSTTTAYRRQLITAAG